MYLQSYIYQDRIIHSTIVDDAGLGYAWTNTVVDPGIDRRQVQTFFQPISWGPGHAPRIK